MSRKTPIHNGILTSDLEANGHKIIGFQADISSGQIVEAVKPELDKLDERVTTVENDVEDKASATIVNLLVQSTDALQTSKADKTELASVEARVTEIEENGSGPAVEVVAPNSSAKEGQAADAKAVFDNMNPTVQSGTTSSSTFVTSITRNASGKLEYKRGSIPEASPYIKGKAYLYGTDILDHSSDMEFIRPAEIWGIIAGGGDHTVAASGKSLALVGAGGVYYRSWERYQGELNLCPWVNQMVHFYDYIPGYIHFFFDDLWDYSYFGWSSVVTAMRCALTVDMTDARDSIPVTFADERWHCSIGGVTVAGRGRWDELTPGVVNRFEIEKNMDSFFIKKYEFEMQFSIWSSSWGSSSWGSSDWGSSDWYDSSDSNWSW